MKNLSKLLESGKQEHAMSTSISDLPEELLWLIFRKIPGKLPITVLILVCQSWKLVIENYFTFPLNNFFLEPRTSGEYQIAAQSHRKAEEFQINLRIRDPEQFAALKSVMQVSENSAKRVKIDICVTDYSVKHFPHSFFCSTLTMFRGVSKLTFQSDLCRVQDFCCSEVYVKFPNLVDLNLTFSEFEDLECLRYLQAPKLESLEVKVNCLQVNFAVISEFSRKNGKFLKVLKVTNHFNNNKMFWDGHTLIYESYESKNGEILDFITPRISNIKRVKILGSKKKNLLRYVLQHAVNLETIHVDCHVLPKMSVTHHLPKVKSLALQYFNDNETSILKLAVLFPNVQVLRFIRPKNCLPKILRAHIMELFLELRDVEAMNYSFDKF